MAMDGVAEGAELELMEREEEAEGGEVFMQKRESVAVGEFE